MQRGGATFAAQLGVAVAGVFQQCRELDSERGLFTRVSRRRGELIAAIPLTASMTPLCVPRRYAPLYRQCQSVAEQVSTRIPAPSAFTSSGGRNDDAQLVFEVSRLEIVHTCVLAIVKCHELLSLTDRSRSRCSNHSLCPLALMEWVGNMPTDPSPQHGVGIDVEGAHLLFAMHACGELLTDAIAEALMVQQSSPALVPASQRVPRHLMHELLPGIVAWAYHTVRGRTLFVPWGKLPSATATGVNKNNSISSSSALIPVLAPVLDCLNHAQAPLKRRSVLHRNVVVTLSPDQRILITAARAVKAGEELLLEYAFDPPRHVHDPVRAQLPPALEWVWRYGTESPPQYQ